MAGPRISQVFPLQLQKWRNRRGLTTQALADRMGELGEPIHPSAITKIESGARKVSLDEAFAFAAALNVPPPTLLLPLDGQQRRVRITAKSDIHPHLALDWIAGDRELTTTRGYSIGLGEWKEAVHHVHLYRDLRAAQDAVNDASRSVTHSEFVKDKEGERKARRQYADALGDLAGVLDQMEAAGIRPPEPPKEWVPDMAKLNLRTGG